ncbi:hypothetical protein [Alteraurantiacibacter aquimixticola]|uniref:Uncharacterized protein n=1 Tax=Alteraurantiacibacter aquimixticola TaxID=2489173 RepID=A0A4T3EYB3_9SPHN|nr:hypothetical protein [Alteraurantiacibacter aquimixticola]TIX49639.1 hypothetical protein E5222_12475 [Alteraurantiacibacter aquimixticola]
MDAQISAGGRTYAVCRDGEGRRLAFVVGQLLDDADGTGLARQAILSCDEPLLGIAQSDKEYALAGERGVALVDESVAHNLPVTVRVPGYRDASTTITVPAFAARPIRLDLALRRRPQTIRGRVLGHGAGANPPLLPVAGASLTISGPSLPGGELPLLLRQPLPVDPAPGATLRSRALAAQPELSLIEPAERDSQAISIADPQAAGPGTIIRLGPAEGGFWAEIAQLVAHPDRAAPAVLALLTAPLTGSAPNGSTIDAFSLAGYSGSVATPQGPCHAGEAVIWVNSLPAASAVLVLRQPGQPDRYFDRDAISGPLGDYTIHGFARMDLPELRVSAAGFATQSRTLPVARALSGDLDWVLAP